MIANPDPTVMPVCAKACGRCLRGPRPLVSPERIDQILSELRESGRAFICHEASQRDEYVVCRAFYERRLSLSVVLARELRRAVFITTSPST